jgi:tripartite-type tricarboxylate transporter receptor subunit TctC
MFEHHSPVFSAGRRAICTATGAAIGLCALGARAATWPNKPMRIIAAQAPGSSNDVTARALADYFTHKLGVPAVVENKPGGVSMIAADAVARSPADGHTLLIALNSQLAQAPVLLKKPPIDPDKDLVPVASIGVGPVTGVAHKDFPAQTLEQLIAYAKKKPVNVGNYAIGSGWQLMLAQLAKQTGAQFNVVNYKGTGAMLMDLYAGQVDIGAGSLAGIGAGIQNGSVKPFVVFTPKRSPRMPDVPTWTEAGFSGPAFEDLLESNVLYVPANTPAAVVAQLAAAVHDAYLESPRLKNVLQVLAEDEPPLTGVDLRRFIDRSWASYRKLTREQGVLTE